MNQFFFGIPAKGISYLYRGYDDYSKYPIYEFSVKLSSSKYIPDDIESAVDVKSNDTGSQIAVTIENKTEKEIKDASIIALFYKDNDIVGVIDGSSDTSGSDGKDININYP